MQTQSCTFKFLRSALVKESLFKKCKLTCHRKYCHLSFLTASPLNLNLSPHETYTISQRFFCSAASSNISNSIISGNALECSLIVHAVQEELNFTDHLYHILKNDEGKVPATRILKTLNTMGLRNSDPRLAETVSVLKHLQSPETQKFSSAMSDLSLNFDEFKLAIQHNIPLIKKAFTGDMIIPNFEQFCVHIDNLYGECKKLKDGKVASYIPQLSKVNSDYWGVSLCTIDGQRYSVGDVKVPFTLQSSAKPISYALAIDEHGADFVHNYVGYEPSGESFNSIKLGSDLKPHNPMVNSGAIVICSMIKRALSMGERFDYLKTRFQSLAGGEHVGFNNSVFLSEKATANRNLALGYYLKEFNCFPPNSVLDDTLDFYFMSCSVEVTATSGAIIAATLANGGYCPITQERVLSPASVRNTLALMHSCGMYDYSGRFAFKVGLPAKSAVSGCILLVVPNVMGMCLWSPPLDSIGNSVRGVHFCEQLVSVFNFHHYDSLVRSGKKIDPRLRQTETTSSQLMSLLFAAHQGDFKTLRRLALIGADMDAKDYDDRTALHLAASGGHLECVKFLIDRCRVRVEVPDRWGHTPLDNAVNYNHQDVKSYLESVYSKVLN